MRISQLRVNNVEHPLGFQVDPLSFSWKVEEVGNAKKMQSARIQIFQEEELLANCYYNSMKLAMEHGIRKIAFSSISTGVYHFPVEKAAHIALETVSQFLKEHTNDFDLVEWVLFDSHTQSVYEAELKKFM